MTINGYTTKTTFWEDFSIADAFGLKAIRDTFKNAFENWKDDYIYLTELAMVLNWKCWQHYEQGDSKKSELYSTLFYKVQNYAYSHLKGKELNYYYRTTD